MDDFEQLKDSFFTCWKQKLALAGTDESFYKSSTYHSGNFFIGAFPYPCWYQQGGLAHRRREFMEQTRPYIQQNVPPDIHLTPGTCHLCGNLAEMHDALSGVEGSNDTSLLRTEFFTLFPNRYPSHSGSSVAVANNHYDDVTRALPAETSSGFYESLFHVADSLNCLLFRNHRDDGMSVPDHDHVHLVPDTTPLFSFLHQIAPPASAISVLSDTVTPWSTLVLFDDHREIAHRLTSIIRQMELEQIPFTWSYHRGRVFVTPRSKKAPRQPSLNLGGTVPMHCINPHDQVLVRRAIRAIPLCGEFDWGRITRVGHRRLG